MKKRLFVMAVLTGVILMVSFSVYADSGDITGTFSCRDTGYVDPQGNFIRRTFNITIILKNNSDYWIKDSGNYFTVNTDFGTATSINETTVSNLQNCSVELIQGLLTLTPTFNIFPEGGYLFAPHETKTLYFEINIYAATWPTVRRSLTLNIPVGTRYSLEQVPQESELTILAKIKKAVEDLSEYFTNSDQSSSDLTTGSNTVDNQESIIHQQEVQWYQANEQAITAVGLENFNFSSGTLSGFQVMQQQFGDIWTALGDFNLIFVFTLTMSLATYITRHFTRTKATEHVTETTTLQENLVTGQKKAYQTTTVSRRIR